MWKIFIDYPDKSKLTLTGKHKDIPLRLAIKYYNKYCAGRKRKTVYQQYPKKDFEPMDLFEKIEQLRREGEIRMTNGDRVRKMTNEELADIIMCPYGTRAPSCGKPNCLECCREWLESEVENG